MPLFTRKRDLRAQIIVVARWGIAHEPNIHYSMSSSRDDWLGRTTAGLKALPLTTDCSGFFTFCYRVAGALDPNGLSYKVLGYTGTLMGHGQKIGRAQVLPGDAVIWGAYPGVHVAMALDAGAKTLASHGQEKGPFSVSFEAENAYHESHGHHVSFWRFPVTVAEQAAHAPAGFVQHPVAAPAKPKPPVRKPAPKPAPVKRRYYTRKRSVPVKRGQTIGYVKGRGYYAKAA